jgi:hypothetical protein
MDKNCLAYGIEISDLDWEKTPAMKALGAVHLTPSPIEMYRFSSAIALWSIT